MSVLRRLCPPSVIAIKAIESVHSKPGKMDIVLEGSSLAESQLIGIVMDTLVFDKFWATVAPLNIPGNTTYTPPQYPTFFTTTQPKYLSSVPRDNIYRQFGSLWFITVSSSVGRTNVVDIWSHRVLHIFFAFVLFRVRSYVS